MGQGVFAQGVSAKGKVCLGGVYHPLPKTATEAEGTHPTGMHSCLRAISFAPCSGRVSLVPLGVISINLSYMVLVHVFVYWKLNSCDSFAEVLGMFLQ